MTLHLVKDVLILSYHPPQEPEAVDDSREVGFHGEERLQEGRALRPAVHVGSAHTFLQLGLHGIEVGV